MRSPTRIAARPPRRSGLPEATVYGVSTFYDDLLQPRGARHVRVCTGTACFAATGDEHVDRIREGLGLELGERSDDGSVSLAETVCLGFCHSSPAVRDGDLIDAGPGVVDRVLAGECAQAAEPEWRVGARRAGADPAAGTGPACAGRCEELTPEQVLEEVKEAEVRGRGGAGFPAGQKWAFAARRRGGREVHRRQRRRGRSRLVHRQVPDGAQPGAPARGPGARRLRGRRRARLRAHPLGVPALEAACSRPPRAERARRAGWARASPAPTSTST